MIVCQMVRNPPIRMNANENRYNLTVRKSTHTGGFPHRVACNGIKVYSCCSLTNNPLSSGTAVEAEF